MMSFVKRHPVLAYYILVFTISWGGILLLIGGPGSIPGTYEQASRLFTPALFIMFAGPFLSGIILNFLYGGKAGLRELWSRLAHWRVGVRWYFVALLTGPLLATAVLFGLAVFSQTSFRQLLQQKISYLRFCLVLVGDFWVGDFWRKPAGRGLSYPNCGSDTVFFLQD